MHILTLGKNALFCLSQVFCNSKYAKMRFRWPGPRWGAHEAPPDQLVGWGGDTCSWNSPHSAPLTLGPQRLRRSPLVPRPSLILMPVRCFRAGFWPVTVFSNDQLS